MKWYPFDPAKWRRKLPPQRRVVLVILPRRERGVPESVACGYMKFGAGDRKSPYFVIPGIGGTPRAWSDCLPEEIASNRSFVPEEYRDDPLDP